MQLWRGMFPSKAPLADDVDFPFLAKQFDLAGGDIRNVALDAAFLAAQGSRIIDMRCLIEGLARQLAKQGKTPTAADFRQYQKLIGGEITTPCPIRTVNPNAL
jgi:ATP-dependent 26S proteasome regulatory subunit